MNAPYKKALFIFRRDLRLNDNTTLNYALEHAETVIPCFIFDIRQVTKSNTFLSYNALQFMIESLNDLEQQCSAHNSTLSCMFGTTETVIKEIIKNEHIDAIFCNQDYTPFSKKRDAAIAELCKRFGIAFHSNHDVLINPPEKIVKKDGSPYAVFTPFFKRSRIEPRATPTPLSQGSLYKEKIAGAQEITAIAKKILPQKNKEIAVHGGSTVGHAILDTLTDFRSYSSDHNTPSKPTTHLSAHLKFGTISIRMAYHAIAQTLGPTHPLLRQLYWRDFFTYIAFHNPSVFGNAFRKKYNDVSWHNNEDYFKAWCTGTTGFPIVDAGMRQMLKTGFMHNRLRMITGSFLVKDLHINWQKGEQFFAQHLVDYDPALNNGNWQWVASTGADAQPYFRIFNPWIQQKKFDPNCVYITTWVPELRSVPTKIIHSWFSTQHSPIAGYPRPIIDHKKETILTKKLYTQF